MEHREERVAIETERYRIEGTISLPREGYRSRLSDYANQRELEFFPINGVTLTPLDAPDRAEDLPFLLVSRHHIVLIRPA